MKSKRNRRAGRRYSKGKISQSAFDIISRTIIVLMCVYIVGHCTSIILGEKEKTQIKSFGEKVIKKGINIVLEGRDYLAEYIEEDNSNSENNEPNAEGIKEYIIQSEIEKVLVEVTTSKEQAEAIKELVANVEAENALVIDSTSSEESTGIITEEQTEEAGEVVAVKTIVPKPKLVGTKYTMKNLKSFKNTIKKFYTVASATTIKSSDLNVEKALNMEFNIEGNNTAPQILIYHTHSQEEFKDTGNSKSKSIVQVGDYLAKILREQFGYNVLHDTSTYDLINGKLDRNKAYEQSREGVSKILKDNPSINLILDLHRDGVSDDVHLVTEVNGKDTATIMFFNGMSRLKDLGDIDYLYNPFLKENLALSLQMKLNAEAFYPGFTRKNYINAYQYNLDLCEKAMLIEMGAQTNSFQEVKNAAEPLAMLIHITMGGEG